MTEAAVVPPRPVWASPLAVFLIVTALMLPRFYTAASVGLIGDEAYYALWSLYPGFSYYDHSPAVAWFVVRARDPRRFVVGAVLAAVVEFVVFYPNIAALPLPTTIFNAYQGLLPTYLYAFQFPVNTDPPAIVPSLLAPNASYLGLPPGPLLAGVLGLACIIVAYSAWTWRLAIAERDLEGSGDEGLVRTG